MSQLKPDILNPHRSVHVYRERPASALVVEEEIPEIERITNSQLRILLLEYVKGLSEDDINMYNYASLAAKLTTNNKDSNTYFHLLVTFFMASIKKTFPDKDFGKLEKILEEAKKELAISIKDANIDNIYFCSYLLGIIEGNL